MGNACLQGCQVQHGLAGKGAALQLEVVGAAHIAAYGDRVAAPLHHDGVAVLKLHAGQLAGQQEVVEIGTQQLSFTAQHPHAAVAAELFIDAAGLVEEIKQCVARNPGIAPRVIHETGYEHTDGLHTLQLGIHLNIFRIEAPHCLVDPIFKFNMAYPFYRHRAYRRYEQVALSIDRNDLIELEGPHSLSTT